MSALRSSASFLVVFGSKLRQVWKSAFCTTFLRFFDRGMSNDLRKLRILRYSFRIVPAICRVVFLCPIDIVVHGHENSRSISHVCNLEEAALSFALGKSSIRNTEGSPLRLSNSRYAGIEVNVLILSCSQEQFSRTRDTVAFSIQTLHRI